MLILLIVENSYFLAAGTNPSRSSSKFVVCQFICPVYLHKVLSSSFACLRYSYLWFLMVPYGARFLIVPYGVLWFLMVSLLFHIGLMGFNCSLVFQLNLPVFLVSFARKIE